MFICSFQFELCKKTQCLSVIMVGKHCITVFFEQTGTFPGDGGIDAGGVVHWTNQVSR